jgi:enoyl-[acyl-carrier protein] reductase II
LAALALGAEGVQIGTRFAASIESSAHPNYKRKIIEAGDSDTLLAFSKIGLSKNA